MARAGGALPLEDGFPGLDKDTRGLVFVAQGTPRPGATALDDLPPLLAPDRVLVQATAVAFLVSDQAGWITV